MKTTITKTFSHNFHRILLETFVNKLDHCQISDGEQIDNLL